MSEFWKCNNYGSKILEKQRFGPLGFKWLEIYRIMWQDPEGGRGIWEYISRPKHSGNPAIAAVAIYARILKKDGSKPLVPIITQYRPPINAVSIELPAGLIDDGESVEQAAVRELKEETGLSGSISHVSETISQSPAISSEMFRLVTIDVDGDLPQNQNPKQELDRGEFIHVQYVEEDQLFNFIQQTHQQKGFHIVGYLYGLALGIDRGKNLKESQKVDFKSQTAVEQMEDGEEKFANGSTNITSSAGKQSSDSLPDDIIDRSMELKDVMGWSNGGQNGKYNKQIKQEGQNLTYFGIAGVGVLVGCLATVLTIKFTNNK
eukprot:TRINITY_DN2570_c0_g2_i2.p1 TRINITY_DN2570_c0_g2~~TRINITY_DN2570_c0_g2_i2.p1  ORF type:complete len:352 (-),score=56.63 TRINITY_DN2570_c0_g2_i2:180-1136(-)